MNKETHKNQIRRYLNGTYMTSEVNELHDALHDALMDAETMDEVAAEVWEEGADEQPMTVFAQNESYKEAERLLSGLNRRRWLDVRRIGYAAVGIAASLVLVFLGLYGQNKWNGSDAEVQLAQVITGFGERQEVVLPDGSKVVLNACSSLQYPEKFDGKKRKVQLNGQAFFDVARNEKQPFMVETRQFHVQVLGTEFDVKSYAEDELVAVEVEDGKVEVSLPDASFRLKKDEQVLMNTISGEFNKKKETKAVAVWRKGSLSFYHTPIRDVARVLERLYNCKIRFQEGQEFANQITGETDNQSLDSLLEMLHIVSEVNYQKEADGSYLIYKKSQP